MQAAFQKYTDNAVSKTINLPDQASIQDIKNIFITAYRLKCKGITVFRYGCKSSQVLYSGSELFEDEFFIPVDYSCSSQQCDF